MELLLRPWRHYADFSGRSRRKEFGLFYLSYYGALFVLVLMILAKGAIAMFAIGMGVFLLLGGLIPGWAVTVRRLHDLDKSGWLMVLTWIPYIGLICWIVIGVLPGTKGENSYGFDPRDGDNPGEHLERVFS